MCSTRPTDSPGMRSVIKSQSWMRRPQDCLAFQHLRIIRWPVCRIGAARAFIGPQLNLILEVVLEGLSETSLCLWHTISLYLSLSRFSIPVFVSFTFCLGFHPLLSTSFTWCFVYLSPTFRNVIGSWIHTATETSVTGTAWSIAGTLE